MIIYIKGDATDPKTKGNKILVHSCNNIGRWGKGFVMEVSKKWKEPEIEYKKIKDYKLGDVQIIKVQDDLYVANLIGQDGIGIPYKQRVNYNAIEKGFATINDYCKDKNDYSIHMPNL